ncbi:NADPH-dependent FMN reductase [Providencia stuartii]|uniref:NADPH-dependent FMN reductase n=1 Tax=Providencia stuartii TaxID=588 RepID=UPI00227D9802|nr:NAD(P)H-dependent oxidoreductase [Providencia stuartii]MDT2042271.1 NAD(P)H-dependent oxidoreductase [Providencia stuartii]
MKIQILIGSVRQTRIGPQIARWVKDVAEKKYPTEILDLRDWHLPMDDEPYLPRRRNIYPKAYHCLEQKNR